VAGMRAILVAAAMTLAACGDETEGPTLPPIETMYALGVGAQPECTGTGHEEGLPEGGPFTRYRCEWSCSVSMDGRDMAFAIVLFERPSAGDEWFVLGRSGNDAMCE
jgi:hypothetical protein